MRRMWMMVVLLSACSSSEPDSTASKPAAKEPAAKQTEAKPAEDKPSEHKPPEAKPPEGEQPEAKPPEGEQPKPEPSKTLACSEAAGDDPDAACNPAFECTDDKDLVTYEVVCQAQGKTAMTCTCNVDGEATLEFRITRDRCNDLLSPEAVAEHCKLDVRLVAGE